MAQEAHADGGMQMPGLGQAAAASNLQMQQLHMQQQQHLQQQQLQLQQFWASQMSEIQKIDPGTLLLLLRGSRGAAAW
jgi:hypothetical protein